MTIESKVKPVSVTWIDAAGGELDLDAANIMEPKEFLMERVTYGTIYKQDRYCVVLATTIDNSNIEYCAIPRNWIKSIK